MCDKQIYQAAKNESCFEVLFWRYSGSLLNLWFSLEHWPQLATKLSDDPESSLILVEVRLMMMMMMKSPYRLCVHSAKKGRGAKVLKVQQDDNQVSW